MTKSDTFISAVGRELERLWADESGGTAIEYAMIASGIGATIAAAFYILADTLKGLFTSISNLL